MVPRASPKDASSQGGYLTTPSTFWPRFPQRKMRSPWGPKGELVCFEVAVFDRIYRVVRPEEATPTRTPEARRRQHGLPVAVDAKVEGDHPPGHAALQ